MMHLPVVVPSSSLAWRCAAVLVGAVLAATQALAQDWTGPPVSEVFSKNRDHFVRVIPGVGVNEPTPTPGSGLDRFAKAEFYRRAPDRSYQLAAEATLARAVAPVDLHLTDHGYLAALDNWRAMGQGTVIALYDPRGQLVRAYELPELFDPEDLAALPRRLSSALRWRQGATFVRPDQGSLLVKVNSNAHFVFGMETGQFRYCELQESRQSRCRDPGRPGQWLPDTDAAIVR